jgi:hypothetical protein
MPKRANHPVSYNIYIKQVFKQKCRVSRNGGMTPIIIPIWSSYNNAKNEVCDGNRLRAIIIVEVLLFLRNWAYKILGGKDVPSRKSLN